MCLSAAPQVTSGWQIARGCRQPVWKPAPGLISDVLEAALACGLEGDVWERWAWGLLLQEGVRV